MPIPKTIKTIEFVLRQVIFGIVLLAVYVLSAPIAIPSLLGLGEIRVLIVSVLSKLLEQGFYTVIKKTVTQQIFNSYAKDTKKPERQEVKE